MYTHKYTIIYLYTLLLQKYEEQDVVPFGLCDPLFGSTSSRTMSRAMPLYVSNTGKVSECQYSIQQQSMKSVVTPIWSFNLPHQRALYYIDKVDFILGIWLLCTYLLSNIGTSFTYYYLNSKFKIYFFYIHLLLAFCILI